MAPLSASHPPPPPLGLALGLLAAAAAIFLATDCQASAIGLQLLLRCSESRFLSAASHGAVAGAVLLIALAYGATALLLVFSSATFAHRWRRTSSRATKADYLTAFLKPAAVAPMASLPAPTLPTGATPRAARPASGGSAAPSPHAARGRAITNARALEAYLSAEDALKRKSAAAFDADSDGTCVGSSLLASPAAAAAAMAPHAGASSSGRHEMGSSRPLWAAGMGSPSSTHASGSFAGTPHAACSRHPLGAAPSGLAPGTIPSPAGSVSYGRSPPVGAASPMAPGDRGPGTYPQQGTCRFTNGMGSFQNASVATASPQGPGAYSWGSPRYDAMGPPGSSPIALGMISASPLGASPFATSPFTTTSPYGAVGLSPFAAASPPASMLGGAGVDHARRVSSGSAGGGSALKYQRAMYIPSSGDKQQDPSVIARRATRLLRALKLLDESVERGSTLSK